MRATVKRSPRSGHEDGDRLKEIRLNGEIGWTGKLGVVDARCKIRKCLEEKRNAKMKLSRVLFLTVIRSCSVPF